jgi:hypothetical protein
MQKLNNTVYDFINEIKMDSDVLLTSKDCWYYKSNFYLLYSKFFDSKDVELISLGEAFILALNKQEKIPVKFLKYSGLAALQSSDHGAYYRAAKYIAAQLSRSPSIHVNQLAKRLKRGIVGLAYRIEKINGGLNPEEIDLHCIARLEEAAFLWKQNQKLFWEKKLTEEDCAQLIHTSRYPEFVKILMEDTILLHQFFTWIIRDELSVPVFIEFPATQERIVESALNGRISRMGKDMLKIQKEIETTAAESEIIRKIISLPFEGKQTCILDESKEIEFEGEYRLTIKQILKIFENKYYQIGDLELFPRGIVNWNCHRMGWWDAKNKEYQLINLNDPLWWQELPLFELLDNEKAKKLYGDSLGDKNWVLTAKAARENINLSYEKTHAYLEIAIPNSSGKYEVYEFGKFAINFPANFWQTLKMFGLIAVATVAYPDENVYNTQRQHVGYSFEVSPEIGLKCMGMIKNDILRARDGQFVFQIEAENCGKWIQNLLEELLGDDQVPNLYRIPLIDSEPEGIMRSIFGLIKKLPAYFHSQAVALIHYPLLPWQGRWVIDKNGQKVWTSLASSSFWQDSIIYLPSWLHKQQEEQIQKGHPTTEQAYLRGQEKNVRNISHSNYKNNVLSR